MTKYWTYQGSAVVGPFTVDELLQLPGFRPQSWVAAQEPGGQRGFWNLASSIPELGGSAAIPAGERAAKPSEAPADLIEPVQLTSNDLSQVGQLLERVAQLEAKLARQQQALERVAPPAAAPREIPPHELRDILAEKERVDRLMLKVEAMNEPLGPQPFPERDRKFVIMTIDDDSVIRHLLRLRLELKGCAVVPQENGPAAIKYLGDPASVKPDMIICDVMMPGMDGYETCRSIRALGVDVPYIFLTSKGASVDKVRGLEAGADDYLLKPFDPHELEAKVARHLRKK